jgi:predicted nucleic acid-binding protein
MEILDDPDREFAASPFLRLEVLPQAVFNKRQAEVAFYEAFFSTVTRWATNLDTLTEMAMREASVNGVEAMDALHVAAAASVGASELITTERPSRSIHRARAVKVLTIHPNR